MRYPFIVDLIGLYSLICVLNLMEAGSGSPTMTQGGGGGLGIGIRNQVAMSRYSREDDRRRSSPYDSLKDRRSHHQKHKSHHSDDKGFNRREWNPNEEKHQYENQDTQTNARYYGRRSNNDDYGNRGNQESSRYSKHGGDREKQYRQRSPSRSDDKSISKRTSGFDVAPPVAGAFSNPSEQVTGFSMAPQAVSGVLQNMLTPETTQMNQLSSVSMFPIQVMTQQATRHARRVYVGGLPPLANEQTISRFFSHVMNAIGGNSAGPGDAVVNVYINHEKKFAFVEMRTVEEASNAMALDGVAFEIEVCHKPLKLKSYAFLPGCFCESSRPTDYNPSLAAPLGPSQPSPYLNLAAAGLAPGGELPKLNYAPNSVLCTRWFILVLLASPAARIIVMKLESSVVYFIQDFFSFFDRMTGDAEGADRIFLGGVPYYFSEAQIKELLESFGPLRGFDLVKDRDTGNSKGYGFCIYKDPSVTDIACAALNGLKVCDKTLTVRRATISGQLKSEQEIILAQAQQHIAMQCFGFKKMALGAGVMNLPGGGIESLVNVEVEIPTKILCLTEVVTTDELMDDGEYEEILEDMREECQKFGELIDVTIPRPIPNAANSEGIGKVFLEYSDAAGCTKAKSALSGRKFGGNSVVALYYPEDKYYGGDYAA
ncbi:hypothetical protein DH2020_008940 [Rehmannia glutinosa]|uniref:RRM domain-containing protein n=1 Tax=Rehmannia glutinosa TaxID=99300 RepID=A0ABR0X7U9_REHGL